VEKQICEYSTKISTSDHSCIEIKTRGIPYEVPILSVISHRQSYYDLIAERGESYAEIKDDTIKIFVSNKSKIPIGAIAARSPKETIEWCRRVIEMCEQIIEEHG